MSQRIEPQGVFVDQHGRRYDVILLVKQIPVGSLDGPSKMIDGMKSAMTRDGERLNRGPEDDTFETLDGEVLRRQ